MAAHTSRSEPASESASSEVMDGAGATGDMIGTIDIQFMIAKGTTRTATRFTTGAITIEEEASVA